MIREIRGIVSAVGGAYHTFWFKPTDPIVVSTLRLFVGGMLFYTMLVWGLELKPFFLQDGGWQSAELVEKLEPDTWATSFLWLVADENLVVCHSVCTAIIFLFWIGLGTPVTKWLAAAIIISYANRVPLANYGLDQINTLLTLYLCAGPCGARLSVDRCLKHWVSGRLGRELALPERTHWAGFSTRLVQVHLSFIYLWAGLSKLQGVSWWNGQAVWRAAANYEYQQVPLTWLADFPWLYQFASIGTWVWEISFIFLVWNRYLRLPVLLVGLSMHIGIGMFMGMWTFGLIMCFAYISFIPARWLHVLYGSVGLETAGRETPKPEESSASVVVSNLVLPSKPTGGTSGRLGLSSGVVNREQGRTVVAGDLMFEHESIVIYVDSSLSSRYRMSKLLKKIGFQCIGVDGWPEAIEIYNRFGARCVISNASRQQQSELTYWTNQLLDLNHDGSIPKCIALCESGSSALKFQPADEACVVVPLPVTADDMAALLDGHVPLHLHNRNHSEESVDVEDRSPRSTPSNEEKA